MDSKFEKLLSVMAEYKSGAQADLETKDGVQLHRAQGVMMVLKELEGRAKLIKDGQHEAVFGDDEEQGIDK